MIIEFIKSWIFGGFPWLMGMFLKDSDELVSSCEAVHVYTDQTTMKPTPITEDLKEKLQFN